MGAFQRADEEKLEADIDRVFQLFPRLHERRVAEGRDAVRRRAADVRHRPCADGAPKLLLLDEPSMGLAPIFVDRIFETIKEVNKEGTPVLLVEQNALMALDVAKRGYVMETGPIALAGPGFRAEDERAGPQDVPRRDLAVGRALSRRGAPGTAARGGSRFARVLPRGRAPSRARCRSHGSGRTRASAPHSRRGTLRR